MRGHVWTLGPLLRHTVRPVHLSTSVPWSTTLDDPQRGRVRLTGRLHEGRSASLVVLVHGLGGTVDSHYVRDMARALDAVGLSYLRVHLRGADRSGDDFYHAGLLEDLDAVLASPEVSGRESISLFGFSLGGHLVLRYAAMREVPTLKSVVAVCPPLDLAAGAVEIDRLRKRPYLLHVLGGLVEMYEGVAARGPVPIPVQQARAIRSIRTWDDRIVAPRHGFRDASHYYAEVSAGPLLASIGVETLIVAGDADPMVPLSTTLPSLRRASPKVDVRVVRGGHVGFPARLDLGERAAAGLEPQLAAWLARRA